MARIPVLLSGNFTAEQVARMRSVHPAFDVIGEAGGIALEPPSGLDAQEMTYPRVRADLDVDQILQDIEVIVASRLPGDIIERAPLLKWVHYLGAGLDHMMPPEALPRCTFTVTNTSGIHAIPLAETVLTMLLTQVKRWREFDGQQRHREWNRLLMGEIYGKTMGIIGLGRVGREIARTVHCLGMRVIAIRRTEPPGEPPAGVDKLFARSQLRTLLALSDVVVCSAPLTSETERMLGEPEFRAMRSSAYFINVGRGAIVDEPALIRALQEGWIAGAGLDVFEQEPLPPESPFWSMPNVFLLPHQGSDTDRYLDRATDLVCENLRRYAIGEPLLNVVDIRRGY